MPLGEDGPFEVEVRVASLVEPGHPPTFGLVLVTLWPADRQALLEGYRALCAATELCFDEPDVVSYTNLLKDASSKIPPVYIYPFTALHVTIATLHAFFEQPAGVVLSEEQQSTLKEIWTGVVQRASELEDWPKQQPLTLTLEHAQIGTKAGILLWNETTGGIEAIRRCLHKVASQPETVAELQQRGISVDTLSIPTNIVHSTFVRFYSLPVTPAEPVRERFHQTVVPRLREFFPQPIECREVRLVCESAPYMHQSVDETVQVFSMPTTKAQTLPVD